MRWNELRRPQLDAMSRDTPVIFPVAAIEQHGEHLPLSTDLIIGEAMAAGLDDACGNQLLILPAMQVGCSEHHMSFPGTLSLQHETFRRTASDVVGSVIRHGFHRIMILNSHGGNQAINGVLGEQLGHQYPKAEILVANWWSPASQHLKAIQEGGVGSTGHACEFETSLLMALAPHLVDLGEAHDDGVQHRVEMLHFDMFHSPAASCYRPFSVLSKTGVFGSPSFASVEKGVEILELSIASLKRLVDEFWPTT